jgi:hypothetical protein
MNQGKRTRLGSAGHYETVRLWLVCLLHRTDTTSSLLSNNLPHHVLPPFCKYESDEQLYKSGATRHTFPPHSRVCQEAEVVARRAQINHGAETDSSTCTRTW